MPALNASSSSGPLRLMRTPRSVDIDITGRCNLSCKYCYHFSGPGDVETDLPTEQWLRFFDQLGASAVMRVCLAGGEPFAREDLAGLIEGIVSNGMRFTIVSNGTLIDDASAAFLRATGRCDGVQVSIDGSTAHVHDSCRGQGSFDSAVAGIRCLQRNRVPVQVRVTIHKHNVQDLENIAAFLLEDLALPAFSTNAASYMGLCRQHADQIGLDAEDRTVAMEALLGLNLTYGNRIHAQAGPLADAGRWIEMVQARRNGAVKLPMGGRLTACGCVWDKIAVRADGIIVPCTLLSHVELGQINQDDLEDIWRHHPDMQKLRNRSRIALSDFAFCRGCHYVDYCTGNCPGLAYTITGEVNHPAPDACLRRFLADGGKLPRALRDAEQNGRRRQAATTSHG